MKLIIELDGPQARRAWKVLSDSLAAEEVGEATEAVTPAARTESLFAPSVATTDAGPAAAALFKAFGRSSDAEAVEKALADLSRRPSLEYMQN